MFVSEKLKVILATCHIPLLKIRDQLTVGRVYDAIDLAAEGCNRLNIQKPKIAVTGLNPHCESILKFNEDKKIVLPAIKSSIRKKINVKGPFPADTIFLKSNRDKFNVILGMYHDQVLTPLKTLFEYDAINITMGLPFLRISPDHGPNNEMMGKNESDPSSIFCAMKFIQKIK